ncbi:hypothetical protein BDA99DRAFT_502968 [Phascolomyces articulosus]|uniref:Uncharacterized protein n=1 Tax=Phascolomyces articulosus TaxID=60185 RepID=A0AAD5KJK9_9FUNG|nr:hypothetical protein BDA99DRAFT_502968 [Phascolomyces articulosus]
MPTSLPPQFLEDLESFPTQIQHIQKAFRTQNFQQLVEYASKTINYIHEQNLLVLALLDIRSYAYSMNRQYSEAHADAQKMTQLAPMSASGYTRVGHLLLNYEQHIGPIELNNYSHSNARTMSSGLNNAQPIEKESTKMNEHSGKQKENVVTDEGFRKETGSVNTNIFSDEKKALTLNEMDDKLNSQSGIEEAILKLYGLQDTLTHLNVKVVSKENPSFTIATILTACSHLPHLTFHSTTESGLSTHIGDFNAVLEHNCLVNLEICSTQISYQEMNPILVKCPQLQCVYLYSGRDISIVELLVQGISSNRLEITNTSKYTMTMEYLLQKKNKTKDVMCNNDHQERGLRHLYVVADTKTQISFLDFCDLIGFMQTNKTTLETIAIEIPDTPETKKILQLLFSLRPFPIHDDNKFRKIKNLTYDHEECRKLIESFMLHRIRDSTTLKSLTVGKIGDLSKLVDTLVNISPLEQLEIRGKPEGCTSNTMDHSALIRLLKNYAAFSSSSSLKTFTLQRHYQGTDQMLHTLAQIKTLNRVSFQELPHLSTKGITNFFAKIGNQLTYVHLLNMHCVDDLVLAVLGVRGNNLTTVDLQHLDNITDQGIRTFMSVVTSKLTVLRIQDCSKITNEDCMCDRKKLNEEFVYLKE